MRRAGKAIEALTEIHERSLSTSIPFPEEDSCTSVDTLVSLETQAIAEVRNHISFQQRLCVSLMAAMRQETPIEIDRVIDAVEDIEVTTGMWRTLLWLNPRMSDYCSLLEEADAAFRKFMNVLATDGIILVVPLRDGKGDTITEEH
jgi:hypothetical protein